MRSAISNSLGGAGGAGGGGLTGETTAGAGGRGKMNQEGEKEKEVNTDTESETENENEKREVDWSGESKDESERKEEEDREAELNRAKLDFISNKAKRVLGFAEQFEQNSDLRAGIRRRHSVDSPSLPFADVKFKTNTLNGNGKNREIGTVLASRSRTEKDGGRNTIENNRGNRNSNRTGRGSGLGFSSPNSNPNPNPVPTPTPTPTPNPSLRTGEVQLANQPKSGLGMDDNNKKNSNNNHGNVMDKDGLDKEKESTLTSVGDQDRYEHQPSHSSRPPSPFPDRKLISSQREMDSQLSQWHPHLQIESTEQLGNRKTTDGEKGRD